MDKKGLKKINNELIEISSKIENKIRIGEKVEDKEFYLAIKKLIERQSILVEKLLKEEIEKEFFKNLKEVVLKLTGLTKEKLLNKSLKEMQEDNDLYVLDVCLNGIKIEENLDPNEEWGSKALMLKKELRKYFPEESIKNITVVDIIELIK